MRAALLVKRPWIPAALLLLVAAAPACRRASSPAASPGPSEARKGPALGTWGFDTTAMDPAVKPGDDFDRYANGAWQARTTIPDDRHTVSMFTQVGDEVQEQLRTILEEAAADRSAPPGSRRQVLGDWYASFVDEPGLEAKGVAPLQAELDRIAAIRTPRDLARYLGARAFFPRAVPLGAWATPDPKDSRRAIPELGLSDGSLSLGDRDAYRTAADLPRRQLFVAHVERMLALAGQADAAARASRVLAFETRLAAMLLPTAERPQGDAAYNLVPPREFARRFPGMDWDTYLAGAGLAGRPGILVRETKPLTTFARHVAGEPLDAVRDYLAYQYLKAAADVLPRALREEHFDFYTKSLGLQAAMKPRRELAVDTAKDGLVRFLGEEYATRFVSPEARSATVAMVDEIRKAFDARLARASWLSDTTRAEARRKLAATRGLIGYPDEWPAAAALQIVRGEALSNLERMHERSARIGQAKLDAPIDRQAWDVEWAGPYYVDATADPTKPIILVYAGILQPPFFDPNADPAANYGGLGVVLAHEFTHLFDKAGSHYDADGNERDWFAPKDAAAFKAMSDRLAAQVSTYEVLPGVSIDGRYTITETLADLGGLHIAFDAYHRSLGGTPAPVIDGLTGDQRFFLAFAQNWRAKLRDARAKQMTQGGDWHPVLPIRPRMVRNLDPWYEAFGVKPGEKLYLPPAGRLTIW